MHTTPDTPDTSNIAITGSARTHTGMRRTAAFVAISVFVAVAAIGAQTTATGLSLQTPTNALSACPTPVAGTNTMCSGPDGFYTANGTAPLAKIGAGAAGPAGPPGQQGNPGTNGANGTNGAPGAAATVAVGTTTVGTNASVTNSGTPNAAVLNFVLPQSATVKSSFTCTTVQVTSAGAAFSGCQ